MGATGAKGATGAAGAPGIGLAPGFDACSLTATVCQAGTTRDTAMEAVLKNGSKTPFCCKVN